MANLPATLVVLSKTGQCVCVSDTAPLYIASVSSAGPHPPNDQLCIQTLTVQDTCQLLHLGVAHFLLVVKELLRKGKSEISSRPDAMG